MQRWVVLGRRYRLGDLRAVSLRCRQTKKLYPVFATPFPASFFERAIPTGPSRAWRYVTQASAYFKRNLPGAFSERIPKRKDGAASTLVSRTGDRLPENSHLGQTIPRQTVAYGGLDDAGFLLGFNLVFLAPERKLFKAVNGGRLTPSAPWLSSCGTSNSVQPRLLEQLHRTNRIIRS
ncbi:hypothetical protein Bbelb_073890 [Branchiostoma belcheri]|nr:hypothetical protein Bbelb_073890 [Branchiostoma belcheri]